MKRFALAVGTASAVGALWLLWRQWRWVHEFDRQEVDS